MLRPWPARGKRKAAIATARRERERSQAGASRAAQVERDIAELAYANHFAASIAADIIARHRGERA